MQYARAQQSASLISSDVETGGVQVSDGRSMRSIFRFVSHIFVESFTLTFLAEWGDRSQITTIILAAREVIRVPFFVINSTFLQDVVGVSLGGTVGHALCTGIAVIGGRLIAQRISVRTVTFVGGVVFIVFALSALVVAPDAL